MAQVPLLPLHLPPIDSHDESPSHKNSEILYERLTGAFKLPYWIWLLIVSVLVIFSFASLQSFGPFVRFRSTPTVAIRKSITTKNPILKLPLIENVTSAITTTNTTKSSFNCHLPDLSKLSNGTKSNGKPKVNVILLGIGSVSRISFTKNWDSTRALLDERGFIPLLGFHNVGDYSHYPILAGHRQNQNQSIADFIFTNFSRAGYLTSFISDQSMTEMDQFGSTDYHLSPIVDANCSESCTTQHKLRHEKYFDFILDQLSALEVANQSHFTFAHHYHNHQDTDERFHLFLRKLLHYQTNSLILLYSNPALHFNAALNCTSNYYESRSPFAYLYLPDSLSLDGRSAEQIRAKVAGNQNVLSSAFDIHATLQHLLSRDEFNPLEGSYSLLRDIPTNRTPTSAHIPPEYNRCSSIFRADITGITVELTLKALEHINRGNSSSSCGSQSLGAIYRAYRLTDDAVQPKRHYRLIHFSTLPDETLYEATIQVNSTGQVMQIAAVQRIPLTRTSDSRHRCLSHSYSDYCLCKTSAENEREKIKL